jgi:octaprenyl-diphosphate synthase
MTDSSSLRSLEDILAPIHSPLQRVESLLLNLLDSEASLLSEIGQYILKAGGKRIRPALLLLAAGAVGRIGEETCKAAGIIEYLHTASLLHDDVVDNSDLRRSKKTARSIWGNEASVLVGDYLFGAAFKLLASLDRLELIDILSDTATMMARGEIVQLVQDHRQIDEEAYLKIIYYKTASLMGTAMAIGAILGGATDEQKSHLTDCGINIGMAFQLVDDALDYDLGNEILGKRVGTDLKERKVTLPLSHLLKTTGMSEKAEILAILDQNTITDQQVQRVCTLMTHYRSREYTLERARDYTGRVRVSLAHLPEGPHTRSIEQLAEYIVIRKV